MNERRSDHLSEEQLARFQDGRLPAAEASHLEACAECGARLRDLQTAGGAYREYLADSTAPSPPQPWRSLHSLIAEHEARDSRRAWPWWMVPALGMSIGLAIAIGLVIRQAGPAASVQVNELLVRSATMELPGNRMISLRAGARQILRPAVLVSNSMERDPDLAHLAKLFDGARYSWQEPLAARSFQSWRSGLGEKRDSVSVIHAGGAEPAYRVRTETSAGVLHSATLTLQGKDLRPTRGAFEFAGEARVEMEEAAALPSQISEQPAGERKLEPKPVPAESPASPADTLHVLAALNSIGADVGEPVEVTEDAGRQVLVRAAGLSAERYRQVAAVLEPLPHVRTVNSAPDGIAPPSKAAIGDRSASGIPEKLRQRFEDRLGGVTAFQEATDHVLEASGLAVAQAHALELLATRFPPQTEAGLAEADRALLGRLRQTHIAVLDDLAMRIVSDLGAILPPAPLPNGRGSEPDLVAGVQQVDDSLNRLLAGSYSESLGETLLSDSARQIAELRRIIDLRKERGR